MSFVSMRRAPLALGAALLLAAGGPAFGPPWISIETPPNPFDAASRGAFLIVHTFHHQTAVSSGLTGTAEGIVGSARRSVRLTFDSTSRVGTYALRKQWPTEGTWMLVIKAGEHSNSVTALVDLAADGSVSRVRVPTREQRGWQIPQEVSAREIDAALQARAAPQLH